MIAVKRAYDPPAAEDGERYLVDRIWPRGKKREELDLTDWLKEVAPSDALRRWFGHDTQKWAEFRRRYFAELDSNPDAWRPLLSAVNRGKTTLVYGAKDEEHNNAVALMEYLERHL